MRSGALAESVLLMMSRPAWVDWASVGGLLSSRKLYPILLP